jgi:opacity protein-like surface antigen
LLFHIGMKTPSAIMVLLLATALAGAASAQSFEARPYIGADALFWNFNFDNVGTFGATGMRVRSGIALTRHLGLEVHGGFGGSDAAYLDRSESLAHGIELDNLVSLFVRGQAAATPRVGVYGLVGYSHVKATSRFTEDGVTTYYPDSDNGISFGAGLEFALASGVSANLDYVRYLHHKQYSFSGVSLGVRLTFARD